MTRALLAIVLVAGACSEKTSQRPAAPPMARGGLPLACRQWAETVDAIVMCKTTPQAIRDEVKKPYDAASATWKDEAKRPDTEKWPMADACAAATKAARDAAGECKP